MNILQTCPIVTSYSTGFVIPLALKTFFRYACTHGEVIQLTRLTSCPSKEFTLDIHFLPESTRPGWIPLAQNMPGKQDGGWPLIFSPSSSVTFFHSAEPNPVGCVSDSSNLNAVLWDITRNNSILSEEE